MVTGNWMYWYHMFGIKQAQKDTQPFQKYLLSGLGKSDEWSGKKDSYVTPALSGGRKTIHPAGLSGWASGSRCRSNQDWWMWVGFNLAALNWLESRLCFEVENSISFRRSHPTSPGKPSNTHAHLFLHHHPPPKGNCRSPFEQKTANIYLKSIRTANILCLSRLSGQHCGIPTNFKGSSSLWSSQIWQLAVKGSQTAELGWAKSRWREAIRHLGWPPTRSPHKRQTYRSVRSTA